MNMKIVAASSAPTYKINCKLLNIIRISLSLYIILKYVYIYIHAYAWADHVCRKQIYFVP